MANNFKTVTAAVLSFEELDEMMKEAFKKFDVEIDDFEIDIDGDNEIAIFFYGGESRINFERHFSKLDKPEIAFGDEPSEEGDEDNYYIVQVNNGEIASFLSTLFDKNISNCFLRDDDGQACVVFES